MNFDIAFVQKTTITNVTPMHRFLFAQQITQIICIRKIEAATDRFILRLLLLLLCLSIVQLSIVEFDGGIGKETNEINAHNKKGNKKREKKNNNKLVYQ